MGEGNLFNSLLKRVAPAFASMSLCVCSQAIMLGQVDDFQDGTVMGWGGSDAPTNIPDGGPMGAGDRYLQLQSGILGVGPHLATNNIEQWIGDYASAGVAYIGVDLRNIGATALSMRIVLFGPNSRFTSTVAFTLPADNLWRRTAFSLAQQDLTRVQGTDTYATMITSVQRLLIRHQAGAPAPGGTFVTGTLGIDNITAAAVPEPSSIAAFSSCALLLYARRRRRS